MSATQPGGDPEVITPEKFPELVQQWGESAEKMYNYMKGLEDKALALNDENETFRQRLNEEDQGKKDYELELQKLRSQIQQMELEKHMKDNRALGVGGTKQRSAKTPDPEAFSGKRDDWERFLLQVNIKFGSNGDWYPTPQDKIRFIYLCLEGDALATMQSFCRLDGTFAFETHKEMLDKMEVIYGEPYKEGVAQQKLYDTRQKNGDFATFLAEIERYAPRSGFNDAALKNVVLRGLSTEMLDQMKYLSHEKMSYHETSQTTTTTTVSAGDPMDLSAVSGARGARPPGPLTPEERAYRKAHNLCNYCGESGHLVSKCPYLEKRRISGARGNVSGVEATVAEGSSTPQGGEASKA
ncbi:hypothetical protein KC332_g9512 [Hortaea werneckii]|nr:hypothetical protein KC358_g9422 [Hortaea werneckii]KAI6825989.1 hypothetical protein KC350_g8639 [Hortaea werneckii]KAI6924385.1 hypothetical protein KC348_g9276 [Hortaea werneckii]KAI6932219.1 hypothetical protein KC341_g9119 [Hortaea werneckii]KAI6966559.1 hypothetical protein KC321_g9503 [Hortaea werneckii]